jgi:hypothetical protein
VAALYGDLLDGYVLDARDAAQRADVEARGVRAIAVDTLMRSPEIATELARAALALARAGKRSPARSEPKTSGGH